MTKAAEDMAFTRRGLLLGGGATALTMGMPSAAADDLSLRNLTRGIRFGAAIDIEDLRDPAMRELFRRHCSSLTPRNALKWVGTEKQPGHVQFNDADKIAAFAKEIGAGLYGHTLIWYRVPGWVAAITDPAELRDTMNRHIDQTVGHFAGQVYAWDVVNEVMEYDSAQWRSSVFYRLLGKDHVREAFERAHRADPKATLVINETHLEKAGANYDARRAMMLDMLRELRAANVPVHAIGLQAHFRPGFDRLDAPALSAFLRETKRLGLGTYITEMDGSCKFAHRLRDPDPDVYGRTFADLVRTVSASGTLRGVTTWGLREKFSKAEAAQGHGCRARALLYDENMVPLPALDALAGALRQAGPGR